MLITGVSMQNVGKYKSISTYIHFLVSESQICVCLCVWTGSSSVVLMSSRQPHTKQVSQDSSATWRWALNAPESCWCLEFIWPKRRWRGLSQVGELTLSWADSGCKLWYNLTVYFSVQGRDAPWWRALWGRMGPFSTMARSTLELTQSRWVLK